jgi:8-oxo-dGTP diphosphatase
MSHVCSLCVTISEVIGTDATRIIPKNLPPEAQQADTSHHNGETIDTKSTPLVGFPFFNRYIFISMVRAAVAILRENGRVLVCQRKRNSQYALKWEFPGGKVESGESPQDCVRRELREELHIDVAAFGPSESQVNRYGDGGVFEVTFCFILQFRGKPVNKIFEEIRWVTLDELRKMDVLEGNRAFVSKLDESIFLPVGGE